MSKTIERVVMHYTDGSDLTISEGSLDSRTFRRLKDILVQLTDVTGKAETPINTCEHVGTEHPSNFTCPCCAVPVDECACLFDIPGVFCDKCQTLLMKVTCNDVTEAWQNREIEAPKRS